MKRFFVLVTCVGLVSYAAFAQDPKKEEERMKQLYESVDREVDHLASTLDLEDWQIFRVDSTLVHDYQAMDAEYKALSQSKVSNVSAYTAVNDKWMQSIYDSYHSFFDEEQWAKYLKQGAAKAQKARDKRKTAK